MILSAGTGMSDTLILKIISSLFQAECKSKWHPIRWQCTQSTSHDRDISHYYHTSEGNHNIVQLIVKSVDIVVLNAETKLQWVLLSRDWNDKEKLELDMETRNERKCLVMFFEHAGGTKQTGTPKTNTRLHITTVFTLYPNKLQRHQIILT